LGCLATRRRRGSWLGAGTGSQGSAGEYVAAVLSVPGRRLLVVDPCEVDDDPGRDVTVVLTPLCARLCGRLYGRRAAAGRAARAVTAIGQDLA
jgi:predicted site-specific integrase-resolvase